MSNLSNKIILVTGASRGIGANMAVSLARAGAKVVVNYAGNEEAATKLVNDIKQTGGDAIAVQADVSKTADVKRLFDEAIAHYGRIDVLINNAGIMITRPIKEASDDDFARQFDINVKGVFNTMREASTRLADNGTIINFSSSSNRLILPGYAIYTATKAAVEQMTKVFAKEVGHRGINVNAIAPGPTNTELFTNGKTEETIQRLAGLSAFNRIADTDDIARIILFLVSDDAKWISAQTIGANGGMA